MEAADETRKHWASLLAGRDHLHTLALGTWLGLAALALGTEAPVAATPAKASAADVPSPDPEIEAASQPRDTVRSTSWLEPALKAWTQALDALQPSAWTPLSMPAENPVFRLLSHPAAVVGSETSPGRLSLEAGLALADFIQGAAAHQTLQSQGLIKALQRFAAEFTRHGDNPVVVSSLDDLATHWGTVGEAALQEHSRSEAYLTSQAELLRKAMRYRVAQRRVLEAASRASDMPTLSDVDEAFASIHSLKAELRGLVRLVQATATTAADKPQTKPASSQRRARIAA